MVGYLGVGGGSVDFGDGCAEVDWAGDGGLGVAGEDGVEVWGWG